MSNLPTKLDKTSLILLIIGLGSGILLTVQWKTPVTRVSNPVTPFIILKQTRDDLISEQNDLKNQISSLQKKINEDEDQLKKNTASKKTIDEIDDYKKGIGLSEITGDGVLITIDDAKKSQATADSIAHAADLRDLVNFLWSVGAEGISINDERIVFQTSIDCIVNTILINSTKMTPPFKIKAIGNSKILENQLSNPENLKDIKKRVRTQGLVFQIEKTANLNIAAFNGSFTLENAHIVEAQ